MIVQTVIGPVTTLLILPRYLSLVCIATVAVICVPTLVVLPVRTDGIMAQQYIIAGFASAFVATAAGLLAWFSLVRRMEDNFDAMPWQRWPLEDDAEREAWSRLDESHQLSLCPFTGHHPTHRCFTCESYVAESAFHAGDKRVSFIQGESVLAWPRAADALNKVHEPLAARVELDEALDFRGNFYFAAVSDCCQGCYVWQRSFYLLPRWALMCMCISLVGALTPWAFQGSLNKLGPVGGRCQSLAAVYGMLFAVYSLAIVMHAFACAIAFMTKYRMAIKFPDPIIVPRRGLAKSLCKLAAGSHFDVGRPADLARTTRVSMRPSFKRL